MVSIDKPAKLLSLALLGLVSGYIDGSGSNRSGREQSWRGQHGALVFFDRDAHVSDIAALAAVAFILADALIG